MALHSLQHSETMLRSRALPVGRLGRRYGNRYISIAWGLTISEASRSFSTIAFLGFGDLGPGRAPRVRDDAQLLDEIRGNPHIGDLDR